MILHTIHVTKEYIDKIALIEHSKTFCQTSSGRSGPSTFSALVLRHLGCARQPMTGRRDARLLAGMLDFSISKYC